jgi:hypothetical protein
VLVKFNLIYMVLYSVYVIEFLRRNGRLPVGIPKNLSIKQILTFIPFNIQQSIYHNLGTGKLGSVVLKAIKENDLGRSITGSDIEKYLSLALYSDIQGQDFPKYLKTFVKKVSK